MHTAAGGTDRFNTTLKGLLFTGVSTAGPQQTFNNNHGATYECRQAQRNSNSDKVVIEVHYDFLSLMENLLSAKPDSIVLLVPAVLLVIMTISESLFQAILWPMLY